MRAESTERVIAARRGFLRTVAAAGGLALAGCATAGAASGAHAESAGEKDKEEQDKEAGEAEVTPGEDLMQEHGVLERILLLYDEAIRRIDRSEPLDVAVIVSAAKIIRSFVEDYHEKQEEQFVFPRLQAAGRETALVTVLLRQHQRGRELTDDALRLAATGTASKELAQVLAGFQRMYRPHAAREDTVLFPAFRAVVGRAGYLDLGEQFEDKEHEIFGEHGFENAVAEVARLETALGIADLAKFTPL